jgi:hypothetical protein
VLGVALAAEVLILLGFDAAVLVQNGFHGFSVDDGRTQQVSNCDQAWVKQPLRD